MKKYFLQKKIDLSVTVSVLLWYLDTPSIPCLTCLCRWNFHSYKRISYSYKHVAEAHIFLHTRRRFLQRISYFLQTRCWILHADYRCLAVNTNSSLLTVVFAATQPPSLPPPKRGRNIFQEVAVEHFKIFRPINAVLKLRRHQIVIFR